MDLYQRIFEFMPDGLLVVGPDALITNANAQAEVMFGYLPGELIAQSIELLIPERFANHVAHRSRYLAAPRPRPMGAGLTLYGRRKDRSEFPVDIMLSPIDPDRPVLCVVRDVTERTRAEAQHQDAVQALRRLTRIHALLGELNHEILRGDPNATMEAACRIAVDTGGFRMAWIGTLDADGRRVIPVASAGIVDGYLDTLRIDVADATQAAGPLGRCAASGAHAICTDIETDPRFAPWRAQALARGYRSAATFPLVTGGKIEGFLSLYAAEAQAHVFDVQELALLDAMADNIAFAIDLKRREDHRRRAEAERQRMEEELRQAQRLESIGKLAGGVAHDFNNMLAVILTSADFVLSSAALEPSLRDDITEIRRAGERAAQLTRQLLAFSRKQLQQPTIVDLAEVVREMEKMLRTLVGDAVELHLQEVRGTGRVYADRSQLTQVVMNLVVNARDAMVQGGRVSIETHEQTTGVGHASGAPPGSYVVLRVSDTGTGMDAETQQRIFEPFFTTKEVGKGTGLGLSTVFGIVRQNGGYIFVDSALDRGSTFEVYLPRTDEVAPAPITTTARVSLIGTETILLVDDDAQVRNVTRTILQRAGYKVLVADSPGDALLICEQYTGEIELLLSDVVMPLMSGPKLMGRVLAMRPQTRILLFSGYTDELLVGVSARHTFLQKPFSADELLGKVRQALES